MKNTGSRTSEYKSSARSKSNRKKRKNIPAIFIDCISGNSGKSLFFALTAVLLWSTVATAFKIVLKEISVADVLVSASFISWVIFGIFVLADFIRHRSAGGSICFSAGIMKSIIFSFFLGLLNPLVYYSVLFSAYSRLPAQIAQPLNYTWPLFLALMYIPIHGKTPSVREITALIISFSGVVLISVSGINGPLNADAAGIIQALGSGIIWAAYWSLSRKIQISPYLRLFTGFTAALMVLIPFSAAAGISFPESAEGITALIWIGLFEMGITFVLWNKALEFSFSPAKTANLVYLSPFISLIWINLVLGERIMPATVAGLAVIVGGILSGRFERNNDKLK